MRAPLRRPAAPRLLAAVVGAGLLCCACTGGGSGDRSGDGSGHGGGYGADTRAGDCFREGSVARFGWGSRVACDQPHTVEVFAVRDAGPELGAHPRAALEQEGSEARRRYLALVRDVCEPAWARVTGFDTLGAALAPGARQGSVLPAVYGDMAVEAAPAAEWDAGVHTVLCYQVFGDPGPHGGRTVPVERPVLRSWRERPSDVPLAVRDCARGATSDVAERRVACDRPHDREYVGHVDAAAFVGLVPGLDLPFLDRFDSVTAPPRDWAVLDALCGRLFGSLLAPPAHPGDPAVTLLAQVYSQEPAWGWAPPGGSHHAVCFARSPRELTRSVLGAR